MLYCWGDKIGMLNLFSELNKGLVIDYGEGGGYKMGKSRIRNFLVPPPQDRVKLCVPPPPFKEWKLYAPPLQYG